MGKLDLGKSGNDLVFSAPSVKEFPPVFDVTITVLTRKVLPYRNHFFPTKHSVQGKYTDHEGNKQDRKDTSFAPCLSSPGKEFESFNIEFDDDGEKACRSIIIPDGRSLHDCVGQYGEAADWKFSAFIYNWTAGCYQVMQDYASSTMMKAIYAIVWDDDAKPATYAINILGQMSGKKRTFICRKVAIPGERPPIEDKLLGILKARHNQAKTAEAIVKDLGLESLNPHIVGGVASPPAQTADAAVTTPVATDDDPFGETAPSVGTIQGKVEVAPPPPEVDDPFADDL